MKAIEIAFIFWLVLGSEIQAHKVHKRILVNQKTSHDNVQASENETLEKMQKLQVEEEFKNTTAHAVDDKIPVIPIELNSTDIHPGSSTESLAQTIEEIHAEVEVPKATDPSVLTNETNAGVISRPMTPEAAQRPQNQTYILSLVIVPSIIPNDNEPHVESHIEVADENPFSANSTESSNTTQSKALISHNDAIDISIDLTRFLNPKPSLKKEIKKFENATTSEFSEIETEMGVLFEITADTEPKHNVSSNANESTPIAKLENPKPQMQIDDIPFFEDFSPVFPLESFFGSLLMPQETIIIETDSEMRSPANFFPMFSAGHEIYVIPNNTLPIKKEDIVSSISRTPPKPTRTQENFDRIFAP